MTTNETNEAPSVVSGKRQAVNRANAKKSTGPKTATGKAMVALNSIRFRGIRRNAPIRKPTGPGPNSL